jgi:ankyrin repeat protein
MRRKWFGQWGVLSLFFVAGLFAAGPDTRLADAARKADRAAIRALLQQHADVNAPQVDGATALHWAAYQDDLETVQMLLAAGANPKAANRYGVTPLSLACINGNAAIIEALIKAGADPNTALPGGETALMTCSRTGKIEAVKVLLAHGADLSAKESGHGQNALFWAAAEGNVDVVNALIKAGADIHYRLISGFTPLLIAVREGKLTVVKALVKAGADVNETAQPGKGSPPHQSQGRGVPMAGTPAIVLAVENGHFELAAWLLDAGADPNAGAGGFTALHAIAAVRKPGVGDNDPPPQGSGNMTSLQLLKKLVEHRANLNARLTRRINVGLTSLNTNGATPFLLAARSADAELMRELAALGADTKIPNVDNSTPLIAAAGLGTRSPGEDAGTESEVIEAMQVALDLGNDINAVDNNGETAMHGAAYKNLPGAVKFLAGKGASIEVWNRPNKHGWTPLWIAEGYRFGNFKPSPDTVQALETVMLAAGVKPVPAPASVRGAEEAGQ